MEGRHVNVIRSFGSADLVTVQPPSLKWHELYIYKLLTSCAIMGAKLHHFKCQSPSVLCDQTVLLFIWFFFFLHCLWLCWSFLFVFICLCCFMLSWLVTVWGSGLICYRIGWMKVLFLMLLMNPWHVQSGVGRLSWLSLIVLLFLWVSDINVSVYLSFFFFFSSFKPLLATCCRNKWNVSRRIYSKQHSVGAGQVCAEGLFQNFSVKQGNSRLIKEVN